MTKVIFFSLLLFFKFKFMKISLKLLLLIGALFVCGISTFSQNTYLTFRANNGNLYKYGGLKWQTISKSDLLKISELSIDDGYVIKSFKLSARIGSAEAERISNSAKFTDAQVSDILKRVAAGAKIYVEDIVVANESGVRRKINPLIIVVAGSSLCEIIEGNSVAHVTYTDDSGATQEYKIYSNDAVIPQSILINAVELYWNAGEIKTITLSAKMEPWFVSETGTGNTFTETMRKHILTKARKGDKIVIEISKKDLLEDWKEYSRQNSEALAPKMDFTISLEVK